MVFIELYYIKDAKLASSSTSIYHKLQYSIDLPKKANNTQLLNGLKEGDGYELNEGG